MKKILKEWQGYIKETERKHPERSRRVAYDHAATKYTQQQTETGGDPKAELKYLVANITYYATDRRSLDAREKQTIEFINQSQSRRELIEDLKLIHYLLEPDSETEYIARARNGKMMIFDDTGPISDDSPNRIEFLLSDLGEETLTRVPSEEELKEIFYFYIAPTNQALWPDRKKEPEPPTTDRFAHLRKIPPEIQARMDKLEAEREARMAAAKLKRNR